MLKEHDFKDRKELTESMFDTMKKYRKDQCLKLKKF